MSNRLLPLALFAALAACAAHAQDEPKVFLREGRPLAPAEKNFRDALAKTKDDAPMTPTLQSDIEIVARHAVYPLAPSDAERKVQNTPQMMSRTVDAAVSKVTLVFQSMESKNTAAQDEFLRKMLEALDLLLLNDKQMNITRVNAGRLLSRLGGISGREETADLMVKVIADPKGLEGARYYALQGLKELIKSMTSKGNSGMKSAKRKNEVVTTLVAFIERQLPFVPNTPEEEDGLRMIRREAIRALAEARVPIVPRDPNGQAALTLCRIAGKDRSLALEPRLDEQVEAAIGLCKLPPDPEKELQVGYVAFQIGKFIAELASSYNARGVIREPWKIHAARLQDALKAMQAAHEGNPTVKTIATASDAILMGMLQGGMNVNPDTLRNTLEDKKPPQASVYKSDEKSVVTPCAPMGDK